MSAEIFGVGINILIFVLAISLAICFLRLALGPDAPNRTVAFDLISIHAVGIFALFAVRSHSFVLLEGAIVTAVLGFLGTVMFARYLRAAAFYKRKTKIPCPPNSQISAQIEPLTGGFMPNSLQLLIFFLIALVGTLFMLISALGIYRLPDIFTRMHSAGKAATLGVSCLLLSTGLYFWDDGQFWRMVALIALFFVTAPIATTSMARAAYRTTDHAELNLQRDDLADFQIYAIPKRTGVIDHARPPLYSAAHTKIFKELKWFLCGAASDRFSLVQLLTSPP